MAENSKEEVYFLICNSVLKMEFEKGHLSWTLSDISKDSGITRSLIYYYFGKEKETVLEEAYRFVIAQVFDLKRVKTLSIHERIKKVLADLKSMPYLFVLYFMEKNKSSKFGKMLEKAEHQLLQCLQEENPSLTSDQVLGLYLKELGAITFHLSEDKVECIF